MGFFSRDNSLYSKLPLVGYLFRTSAAKKQVNNVPNSNQLKIGKLETNLDSLLQKIHLPDSSAFKELKRQLDPVNDPVEAEEYREMEITALAGKINGQLKETESPLLKLKPEEQPYLEEALILVFNQSEDLLLKLKILELATDLRILFSHKLFGDLIDNDMNLVNNFIVNRVSAEDLIENLLVAIDQVNQENNNAQLATANTIDSDEDEEDSHFCIAQPDEEVNHHVDIDSIRIAKIINLRSDRDDLIQKLFAQANDSNSKDIGMILWGITNQQERIDNILSIEQCAALYRMITKFEGARINRLLLQVRDSFPEDIVIKYFERILRGKESDAMRYAVHHYAEYAIDHQINPLAKLQEALEKFNNPDNILSTCVALSRYGKDAGRKAIENSVIKQSLSKDKVQSILYTLCYATQFNSLDPAIKIFMIPELRNLLHSLFSNHETLMQSLQDLETIKLDFKFVTSHRGNIYLALLKQIQPDNLVDWLIEEAKKTPDLRTNVLATNILDFLAKFQWYSDGQTNYGLDFSSEKLDALRALLGIED